MSDINYTNQSEDVTQNAEPDSPKQSIQNKVDNRPNIFMTLSICLGVFALMSSAIFFIAIPAGALGILFAILSKGGNLKLQLPSKIGFGTSLAAILFSITITGAATFIVMNDPASHAQLNDMCKQAYGVTFDAMIEEIKTGQTPLTEN